MNVHAGRNEDEQSKSLQYCPCNIEKKYIRHTDMSTLIQYLYSFT